MASCVDTREESESGVDPRTDLSGVLRTEVGADPCTDSREESKSGADLGADSRGESGMETWLDSCTDSCGELLGVGGPCTEPQGKPDTEGGVNPSSDTWGVLLGCGGARILRKLGIEGERDSCTDPRREFLVVEVPGTDTRVESGTEGGAD